MFTKLFQLSFAKTNKTSPTTPQELQDNELETLETQPSHILRFLAGEKNHQGYTYQDYLDKDWDEFEKCSGHFQWLFPLHEESNFNSQAPIVTEADIDFYDYKMDDKTWNTIRSNLGKGVKRYRYQLGLQPKDNVLIDEWARRWDHNHLRITRAIRSLRLFDLEDTARTQLFNPVITYAKRFDKDGTTLLYWWKAMFEPVFDSLKD
jgi:hypothetical protein